MYCNLIFQIDNHCFILTNFFSILLTQFLHSTLHRVRSKFTKVYLINHLVDQVINLNFCHNILIFHILYAVIHICEYLFDYRLHIIIYLTKTTWSFWFPTAWNRGPMLIH